MRPTINPASEIGIDVNRFMVIEKMYYRLIRLLSHRGVAPHILSIAMPVELRYPRDLWFNAVETGDGLMERFRALNSRTGLLLLTILAILPLFLLSLHSALEISRLAETQVRENLLQLARQMAAEKERLDLKTRDILSTLADAPALLFPEADPQACNAQLEHALKIDSPFSGLQVCSPEGKKICGRMPVLQSIPPDAVSPCCQRASVEAGHSQEYVHTTFIRLEQVLHPAHICPIPGRDGNARSFLFAVQPPDWFDRIATNYELPDEASVDLLNREGMVLARHPYSRDLIGSTVAVIPAAAEQHDTFDGISEIVEQADSDGVERLYAIVTLSDSGEAKYLRAGIPKDSAYSKSRRLLKEKLLFVALATLLAVLLIWGAGNFLLLRGLSTLVNATRKLAEGDLSTRTGLPCRHGELGMVGSALDEMAEALQRRQIESEQLEELLRDSGRRLRAVFNQTFQFMGLLQTNGCVLEMNQSALTFVGMRNSDVFGKYFWDMKWWRESPESAGRLEEAIMYAAMGHFVRGEAEFMGSGDVTATIDFSIMPISDENNEVELLLFEGRDITERKVAEMALHDSEKQLRHLSSQLLTAQEKERKRIANELHDSIGQSLSAIKFSIENTLNRLLHPDDSSSKAESTVESLESLVPMVQLTIEDARRIMTDLRPSILDDLGIVATIGWFCRQHQRIHPNVTIDRDIDIEEEHVPDHLKIVIYRVIQEAFHNIAKYSRAEFVDISLGKKEAAIELVIADSGEGFSVEDATNMKNPMQGLGLSSMKERTELFGGSFSIESIIGEGTTIRARWPLSEP